MFLITFHVTGIHFERCVADLMYHRQNDVPQTASVTCVVCTVLSMITDRCACTCTCLTMPQSPVLGRAMGIVSRFWDIIISRDDRLTRTSTGCPAALAFGQTISSIQFWARPVLTIPTTLSDFCFPRAHRRLQSHCAYQAIKVSRS